MVLMLIWNLCSSRNFSLTFVCVYLQFSLQLYLSFCSDVAMCVCICRYPMEHESLHCNVWGGMMSKETLRGVGMKGFGI